MKSSSNNYISNLDHLRAFAAFMVFLWHFIHYSPHCPNMQCDASYHIYVPFLSMLEQGYTGVALFMCISGYIFTYLTYHKRFHIGKFWLNRFLRLMPLVIFWGITESLVPIQLLMEGKGDAMEHLSAIAAHVLHPQGSWTIYIELQYYLALPLILFGIRRFGPKILLWFLLALVANRFMLWHLHGTVQEAAYWTIWGHADQFLLGTAAFHLEQHIKNTPSRHPRRLLYILGAAGFILVMALYEYIEFIGGVHENPEHPSPDLLWVFLPTIEGLGYSLMVIAYLQFDTPRWLDRPLSALGRWSYSIYLNHFEFVPFLYYIASRLGMTDNFYLKLLIATFIIFPLFVPLCALSYQIIEKPFLRLRKNYLLPAPQNP